MPELDPAVAGVRRAGVVMSVCVFLGFVELICEEWFQFQSKVAAI